MTRVPEFQDALWNTDDQCESGSVDRVEIQMKSNSLGCIVPALDYIIPI